MKRSVCASVAIFSAILVTILSSEWKMGILVLSGTAKWPGNHRKGSDQAREQHLIILTGDTTIAEERNMSGAHHRSRSGSPQQSMDSFPQRNESDIAWRLRLAQRLLSGLLAQLERERSRALQQSNNTSTTWNLDLSRSKTLVRASDEGHFKVVTPPLLYLCFSLAEILLVKHCLPSSAHLGTSGRLFHGTTELNIFAILVDGVMQESSISANLKSRTFYLAKSFGREHFACLPWHTYTAMCRAQKQMCESPDNP